MGEWEQIVFFLGKKKKYIQRKVHRDTLLAQHLLVLNVHHDTPTR